jgi:hypothetical protein
MFVAYARASIYGMTGKVRSYIRCVDVECESNREEEFYDVQLDVRGCAGVHDSFKQYIAKVSAFLNE